ncbi:MAG: cysteine--tRNA ligase [Candidatus Aminicenantes bacterium]|nr:cysteine--tRNA ligase [Candidatus Aminicenantes bacterium]
MIRFFNTLSGRVEDFRPLQPGRVGMYTCGPTVYDYAHIGNFRSYIFEDLLKRFLIMAGFRVRHVMNITDVDDKTIQGARDRAVSLEEFTRPYVDAFFQDIRKLNILPADVTPRATEHIPEMVRLVRVLLDKGFAYSKDGSIYFSIAKFPSYGRLSKIDPAGLQPGRRGDSDEYAKDSVRDFALWKKAKEGEPSWPTELGDGRPGWHIECSAMSTAYLGETFDIHCGGVDNIFPHHENEIAQSEAASGKPFVRTWLHCHHLIRDGEKMSKSKGNHLTLRDLFERGVDPLDLRFLLLGTHYRKTLNFTFAALEQAAASRKRLQDFVYELGHMSLSPGETPAAREAADEARLKFAEGLGDDLNISTALTSVFELVRKTNQLAADGALRAQDAEILRGVMKDLDGVLGVLDFRDEDSLPERLRFMIEERETARRAKDFRLADRLRDALLREGVHLEDTKDGVRWKYRKTAPRR